MKLHPFGQDLQDYQDVYGFTWLFFRLSFNSGTDLDIVQADWTFNENINPVDPVILSNIIS